MLRVLLGIIVAVLLAACAAPAPPTTATTPRPAAANQTLVVLDCGHQPQVRPTSYLIACADGGNLVDQLRWSSWGPTTAAATGVATVNDCLPDCAGGHDHSNPVAVTLLDPMPWPGHPGTQQFTNITVHYLGTHPVDTPPTQEYSLRYGDSPN